MSNADHPDTSHAALSQREAYRRARNATHPMADIPPRFDDPLDTQAYLLGRLHSGPKQTDHKEVPMSDDNEKLPEGVERTLAGETLYGFPVAAYREPFKVGETGGWNFATHWSTLRNTGERLFTEEALRQAIAGEAAAAKIAALTPKDRAWLKRVLADNTPSGHCGEENSAISHRNDIEERVARILAALGET